MITIKSQREIDIMRRAGNVLFDTLKIVEENVKVGVSTKMLDRLADDYIVKNKAKSSSKGYNGFPASICTSVNNEVIHGIPGSRQLVDGDIVGVDISINMEGYHVDAARTFAVGNISEDARRLIEVTEQSFFEGIKNATPRNRLFDISSEIQRINEQAGFSVVREFLGHGIGKSLHEEPNVPNFGKKGKGIRLQKGMTLAVEPMVNMGSYEVSVLKDRWTIVTADGKLSAHYENTILITDNEPEILTLIS